MSLVGGNASWGQLGDSAFTLGAGTNATTTLRVTPPKDTEAKNGYSLVVRATSEDGVTTNSRNSFINVDQIFEVSVQVSGDSSKKGDPGDELTYSITVKNKGNGEDTVSLTLEGDKASWGSIIDEVELTSGESTTVNLTVNIDDDAIALLVRAADGSVRDSLSLLDQAIVNKNENVSVEIITNMLGLADRGKIYDLLENITKGDASNSLSVYKDLYNSGADILMIFEELLNVIHSITQIKISPDIKNDISICSPS